MVEEKKYGKKKIILLCGVFLVMTGLGMTLPVLPFYNIADKTSKEKRGKYMAVVFNCRCGQCNW